MLTKDFVANSILTMMNYADYENPKPTEFLKSFLRWYRDKFYAKNYDIYQIYFIFIENDMPANILLQNIREKNHDSKFNVMEMVWERKGF